jgi:hypothetical protein
VPSLADYMGHPNVMFVPLVDMPPSTTGLVWRRRGPDRRAAAFVRVAREIVRGDA